MKSKVLGALCQQPGTNSEYILHYIPQPGTQATIPDPGDSVLHKPDRAPPPPAHSTGHSPETRGNSVYLVMGAEAMVWCEADIFVLLLKRKNCKSYGDNQCVPRNCEPKRGGGGRERDRDRERQRHRLPPAPHPTRSLPCCTLGSLGIRAEMKSETANSLLGPIRPSLAFREMPIKTTVRYHFAPNKMAKIKNTNNKCW